MNINDYKHLFTQDELNKINNHATSVKLVNNNGNIKIEFNKYIFMQSTIVRCDREYYIKNAENMFTSCVAGFPPV